MANIKTEFINSSPDLETICRLCLEPESGVVNIFGLGQLSIPVRIMACAALEVQSTDGLPKLICSKCRFQLEKSYFFRKKCQMSDGKLRKHIRLLNAGKISRVFHKRSSEDDDEDDEELQFKESLEFIREEEQKLENEEEEKRSRWMAEQQEQFRKEETQKLFEEFGNFVKSRKLVEKSSKGTSEKIEFVLKHEASLSSQTETFPPKEKSEESPTKRHKIKIMPRKPREEVEEIEADNEITSSEQIPEEQEQILIYNDDEGETTDGTIQTYILYGKNDDDEAHGQIIEIESERLDELKDDLNQDDVREAVDEGNVDAGVAEEEESEDFMFSTEYEECDNRDNDEDQTEESVNMVQSYQIEEVDEIHYLKDDGPTETMSISDDDDVQSMLDSIPQYQMEECTEKNKLKRKAPDSHSDTQSEKKALAMIAVNYAKISTEDLKIFKCSECPQSFTRENSLLRHRSAHKKGREYSCDQCDKWFSCKSSLDRHIRIHTGEKPFTCEQCGKSYMQKEVLKRHLAIHSGERPHPCPHCPRAFVQKLMLTQHINATHLEVPQIQKHVCHLCPKSFHHASGLSRHLITHSGMKFRCSECGRSFNDKSSIRRHVMSVHSKSKDRTTIQATRVSPKHEPNEFSTEYII